MANSLAWINAGVWTPASEASLLGWWKADSLSLSNNDPVSSWNDSSASGYAMTQTGSARPTYETNIKNGLPSVLFTGASSQYLTSSMPSNTNPFTVAAVIMSNTFSTFAFNDIFATTADGDMEWVTLDGSAMKLFTQNGALIASLNTTFNNGSWYILIATYNTFGDFDLISNDTDINGGNNPSNPSFTGGGFTLMGGNGHPFDGYIGEIMKFSSIVNYVTIHTYLNAKWAVH